MLFPGASPCFSFRLGISFVFYVPIGCVVSCWSVCHIYTVLSEVFPCLPCRMLSWCHAGVVAFRPNIDQCVILFHYRIDCGKLWFVAVLFPISYYVRDLGEFSWVIAAIFYTQPLLGRLVSRTHSRIFPFALLNVYNGTFFPLSR